ncbi:hypothetical protein [Streptosporangium sp. NPDC001681]|uniref:hypothetical protein n=1 Tax=Streptosporangium sp. NPDC001681 TaxID=3154395 RepID=UPI00332145E4
MSLFASVSPSLSEERLELRDAVRSFLVRYPDAPWVRFAAELGVAGLAVPARRARVWAPRSSGPRSSPRASRSAS